MSRWAGAAGLSGILITGQWRGPAWLPLGQALAAFTPSGCLLTRRLPPLGQKVLTWELECAWASSQQRLLRAPEDARGRNQSKGRGVSLA